MYGESIGCVARPEAPGGIFLEVVDPGRPVREKSEKSDLASRRPGHERPADIYGEQRQQEERQNKQEEPDQRLPSKNFRKKRFVLLDLIHVFFQARG